MKQTEETVSAHRFQTNGFYERLAEMRKSNPRAFATISPVSKLALYGYEKQKREHKQLKEN